MDLKQELRKKVMRKIIMHALSPIIIGALILIIIVVFITSMANHLFERDGTVQKKDWSNVPYADQEYTNNLIIEEGMARTSLSAQEVWDKLLENKSIVNKLLNEPDELKKLMNAELVTQFLDTRPNPDEAIDWNKINSDATSKEVQGIVKLKRSDLNGDVKTMIYTDPKTFNENIKKYNQSGSEEDKQEALKYFTLEKGGKNSSSTSYGNGKRITEGTEINIPPGLGSVRSYMGWQCITAPDSLQYKLIQEAGMNFDEEGFGVVNGRYVIACTTTYGQVGDYVDFYLEDGSVMQCIIGDIKNQNDAGCNTWGHMNGDCIIESVVDKDTWYFNGQGVHENPGNPSCHPEWRQCVVKAVNGGSYFDNPDFGSNSAESNSSKNSTNSGNTKNDTSNTSKDTSNTSADTASTSGGAGNIDFEPDLNNKNYYKQYGNEGYCQWYALSRAREIYGVDFDVDPGLSGSPSRNTPTFQDWLIEKYPDCFEKSTEPQPGSIYCITGDSVGHVGFIRSIDDAGNMIIEDGNSGHWGNELHYYNWADYGIPSHEYPGLSIHEITADSFFASYGGQGNVEFCVPTGSMSASGGNSSGKDSSGNSTYYAKIATWQETTREHATDDPNDPSPNSSNTTYSMKPVQINYQELLSGYTMPFEFLWDFLVTGQEKEFVLEVSDLVYNSDIEITVHDALKTTTNIKTETYDNKVKTNTRAQVYVTYQDVVPDPTPTPSIPPNIMPMSTQIKIKNNNQGLTNISNNKNTVQNNIYKKINDIKLAEIRRRTCNRNKWTAYK